MAIARYPFKEVVEKTGGAIHIVEHTHEHEHFKLELTGDQLWVLFWDGRENDAGTGLTLRLHKKGVHEFGERFARTGRAATELNHKRNASHDAVWRVVETVRGRSEFEVYQKMMDVVSNHDPREPGR